jgi:hypothetical protein
LKKGSKGSAQTIGTQVFEVMLNDWAVQFVQLVPSKYGWVAKQSFALGWSFMLSLMV